MTTREKQSHLTSVVESFQTGLMAAPTAFILHAGMMQGWGVELDIVTFSGYLSTTWIAFFMHGVAWKYINRRIYEKYNIHLNIKTIPNLIKGKFK